MPFYPAFLTAVEYGEGICQATDTMLAGAAAAVSGVTPGIFTLMGLACTGV